MELLSSLPAFGTSHCGYRRRRHLVAFTALWLAVNLLDHQVEGNNSDRPLVPASSSLPGSGVRINNNGHHAPPKGLITTLTIIFSVFGIILLAACAALFVHFFVTDLSDYILCCFHKHSRDATSLSSGVSCLRFRRCMLPSLVRCRHEPIALSRSNNRQVYRPHLIATEAASPSIPGVPACLNFRRRTDTPAFLIGDDTTANGGSDGIAGGNFLHQHQQSYRNHQRRSNNAQPVFSSSSSARLVTSPSPPGSRGPQNRRSSLLSSFYANSVFLPDDVFLTPSVAGCLVSSDPAASGGLTYQLPQPPSYDDAVGVSSFTSSRRQPSLLQASIPVACHALRLQSLCQWNHLPPPPPYDEIVHMNSGTVANINCDSGMNDGSTVRTNSGNNDTPVAAVTPLTTANFSNTPSQSAVETLQQRQLVLDVAVSPDSHEHSSTNSSHSISSGAIDSSNNYAFNNSTYLATSSRADNLSSFGLSSMNDYKPLRSQRLSRTPGLLSAAAAYHQGQTNGNSNAHTGQFAYPAVRAASTTSSTGFEDASNPTIYDVTHVYSWHI